MSARGFVYISGMSEYLATLVVRSPAPVSDLAAGAEFPVEFGGEDAVYGGGRRGGLLAD